MMTTTPHISDSRDVDNRPLEEVNAYLEARCEVLARRVHELEIENAELKRNWREAHETDLERIR